MSPQEFLERVTPAGLIVIAKPAGRGFKHYVCKTFIQAANQAVAIDGDRAECYFGLGALHQEKVFNEAKQKWEIRVGSNIRALKSFFIDFDVDPESDKKYNSQQEAILACKDFCKSCNFPAPMIVSSGGGLHTYWPLEEELLADEWRIYANRFKACLTKYGIKFDTMRTADASSVLRVIGTNNYKRAEPRPVYLIRDAGPYPIQIISDALATLERQLQLDPPKSSVTIAGQAPSDLLGSNMEFPPQDPAAFKPILMGCHQMQILATTGGDSEPVWYAGLQLVRHCEKSLKASRFISEKYHGFDEQEMLRKIGQLTDGDIGPTTCQRFIDINPSGCLNCPHQGSITTPLQLGRQIIEAEPPLVELPNEAGILTPTVIPNPPWPYARRATGGIVVRTKEEGSDIDIPKVVHDYDMYPLRRIYSERMESESTIWRVNQPIIGWTEVYIEQAALAEPSKLHAALLSKGIYVPSPRLKLMVGFMIAYISELQKQSTVEKTFSRMAWQDDFKSFVLDNREYHRDGNETPHLISPELKQELPGLHTHGTLEGWKEAIQFYNNPGYEAHRFLLYSAFGSPLMHMTGHNGAILNATGKPGVGKSTTLQAISSVWGHPVQMIINGTKAGTTPNALMTLLGMYNNLPFPLDEITRMDPRLVGDLCLAVTQGTGKRRNNRNGMLSKLVEKWSNIVITTANTDIYVTLAGDRRDATAESMRAFQIPIALHGFHTKAQADHFLNVSLQEHYGHAGHVYASYIAKNYVAVKQTVLDVTNLADTKGHVQSGERFWSAIIAACVSGALVARQLGLLRDFPVEQDFKWAISQIKAIRSSMREQLSSPREVLSEFLEAHIDETLAVSLLGNPNIAPKINIAPRGALTIRHEVENGIAYIVRSSIRLYCNSIGANFSDIQESLERENVLLERNALKVLGAGTEFGKGQSRCWKINIRELEL